MRRAAGICGLLRLSLPLPLILSDGGKEGHCHDIILIMISQIGLFTRSSDLLRLRLPLDLCESAIIVLTAAIPASIVYPLTAFQTDP